MAGKKNMKNFEATFLNLKDETVAKKEFLARNHTSALRKANRLITKKRSCIVSRPSRNDWRVSLIKCVCIKL